MIHATRCFIKFYAGKGLVMEVFFTILFLSRLWIITRFGDIIQLTNYCHSLLFLLLRNFQMQYLLKISTLNTSEDIVLNETL